MQEKHLFPDAEAEQQEHETAPVDLESLPLLHLYRPQGGLLFLPDEAVQQLEDEEALKGVPFDQERERLCREDTHPLREPQQVPQRQLAPKESLVTFLLLPAWFMVLAGMIVLALLLPTPSRAVSFPVSVPSFPLPTVTKTETVTARATGVKTSPATTAHGRLTLTNGSVIAQQVPAGMIVAAAGTGREMVTDEPVFVPAGSAEGFGLATVSAHALLSGASGNIAAGAINTVEGSSLYIRNLQPFSGGRDAQTMPYLTAQDVQRAASALEPRLHAQTPALFASARVLDPTCTTTVESQPKIGQTTQRAVVTVSETCRAFSYSLGAVKTAIISYSHHFGAGTLSDIQFQLVETKGGTVTLYVTATWKPTVIVRPYPAGR